MWIFPTSLDHFNFNLWQSKQFYSGSRASKLIFVLNLFDFEHFFSIQWGNWHQPWVEKPKKFVSFRFDGKWHVNQNENVLAQHYFRYLVPFLLSVFVQFSPERPIDFVCQLAHDRNELSLSHSKCFSFACMCVFIQFYFLLAFGPLDPIDVISVNKPTVIFVQFNRMDGCYRRSTIPFQRQQNFAFVLFSSDFVDRHLSTFLSRPSSASSASSSSNRWQKQQYLIEWYSLLTDTFFAIFVGVAFITFVSCQSNRPHFIWFPFVFILVVNHINIMQSTFCHF